MSARVASLIPVVAEALDLRTNVGGTVTWGRGPTSGAALVTNSAVGAAVGDSDRSVVYDIAENRLHVQKAIMCMLTPNR